MSKRLIDHYTHELVTLDLAPDSPPDGWTYQPDENSPYGEYEPGEETITVLNGRHLTGGVEHLTVGGLGPTETIPTWQIAGFHGPGTRLACTAWTAGFDPRTTTPDGALSHVDPTGTEPLDLCPIHQL